MGRAEEPVRPIAFLSRRAPDSVRLLLLASLLLIARGPAGATTLRMLDLAGLSSGSSDIVLGTVEDVHAHWTADHHTIITEVRVRVEDRLKGEGAGSLTLVEPGGEVDGVRVEVDAVPVFTVGERAVLFAKRAPGSETAHVLGMAQGKFEVTSDAAGIPHVQRLTPGFSFGDARSLRASKSSSGAAAATPASAPTLEDFLATVRTTMNGAGR